MVKYKNLLKKDITIDYLKSLTATDKSIEVQLNKDLRQIIINKQKDQFINSLKTKKYRHLFSEETESLISTILDENISVNALKYQFFNKIARYNDENNLINDLEQFKIKNTNWNQYHYLNLIKSKKLNVDIVSIKDKVFNIIYHSDIGAAGNHIKIAFNQSLDYLSNCLHKLCNPICIKSTYEFDSLIK